MDVHGSIVYADSVLAGELGIDTLSLSGKHISGFCPSESMRRLVRRVSEDGIPRKLKKNSTSTGCGPCGGDYETYLLPVKSDFGKVAGVVFCRLEQRNTRKKRTSKQQKYKTLFDNISVPVFIVEKEGIILECNLAACEYTGNCRGDLIGMTLLDFIPSWRIQPVLAGINGFTKRERGVLQVYFRQKSGKYQPAEVSLRAFEYGDSEVLLAEVRGIADRGMDIPASQGHEDRFYRFLDAIPLAGFLWRKNGNFIVLSGWNTAADRLTGGAVPGWSGETADRIGFGESETGSALTRCMSVGKSCTCEEESFPGVEGNRRVRVTVSLVPPDQVLMCVEDMRRSEHELQNHVKALLDEMTRAEERERLDIASDIHDCVNQTLAAAQFRLEELEESMSPGTHRESVTRIRENVEEAIRAAHNLLTGLSPPILQDCGLEEALRWVVGQFQEESGINARFICDGGTVRFDRNLESLLFKSVRELMRNVKKHSRAKNVNVSIKRDANRLYLRVEDDGNGFETSKLISSGWKGGSGFGLHSIRERLYYAGGDFMIESALFQGTRCTVSVPIGNSVKPQREYDEYQDNYSR